MDKSFIASQTARMMLEVQAIQFNAEKPFIFTSGWASPVYVDCRKLISFPRLRRRLMDFAAEQILSEIGTESIDAVAGGETAGIPFSAWLADRLMLPMLYVRKKAKFKISGVTDGSYRIYFTHGVDWDGKARSFTRECSFERFQSPVRFKTTYTATQIRWHDWRITLHAITGGNAKTSKVDPDDFPA